MPRCNAENAFEVSKEARPRGGYKDAGKAALHVMIEAISIHAQYLTARVAIRNTAAAACATFRNKTEGRRGWETGRGGSRSAPAVAGGKDW